MLLEPLLICMVASFVIVNWTPHRDQFLEILHELGPVIYIAFFTLTGASLDLEVLAQTWKIALALFFVRLALSSSALSWAAPLQKNPKSIIKQWMAYVTQAGVGLGLAKEVAANSPNLAWILPPLSLQHRLNQIAGPALSNGD